MATRHPTKRRTSRRLLLAAAALAWIAAASAPAGAKRAAPVAVAPVVSADVAYSAPPDRMGVVVARDAKTGAELWEARIYRVPIDPSLERDVQDVFITSLRLHEGSLIVTNERDETYRLDLATRKVTREHTRSDPPRSPVR